MKEQFETGQVGSDCSFLTTGGEGTSSRCRKAHPDVGIYISGGVCARVNRTEIDKAWCILCRSRGGFQMALTLLGVVLTGNYHT